MARYEKISEKKQRLIDEYLSTPISVGEEIVIHKGTISSVYKDTNRLINAKVIAVDGENLVIAPTEYGYEKENHTVKKSDVITRDGLSKIGANPFVESGGEIRPLSFSMESIIFGLELSEKKRNEEYIFDGVICCEVNWNPFVYNKEGKKQYYQRELCWSLEEKQNLIESIYNGINLGLILIRKRSWSEIEKMSKNGETELAFKDIVDGKQRLNAIKEFLHDEFPDIHGNYFSDLSSHAKNKMFNNQNLQYAEMDGKTKDSDVVIQFLKLNFSGVPQSKEHIEFVKDILKTM